jgi:hypothetical protein
MKEVIDKMKLAQIRQEQRTSKSRIMNTQTWSSGHQIEDIRSDFADQIRAYRQTNFASLDAMVKAASGIFGKKDFERFEAGYKPTILEAKSLASLFDGLNLVEERNVFSPVLTAWERLVVELGGDLVAAGSFEQKYFEFLEPHINKTHQILLKASENRSETEAETTWNGVRKWDGSVQCQNTGCTGKLLISEASNTRGFYDETKRLLLEYHKQKINAASTAMITKYKQTEETVPQARKRIIEEFKIMVDAQLDGVFNYKEQSVNTFNVRGVFRAFLWEGGEATNFGDFDIDLIDFSNDEAIGNKGYSSRGAFTKLELSAIHDTGDIKASKIAHRLNICADRHRMPTCDRCRTTKWTLSPDTYVEPANYFQSIAQTSTQVALESILSSSNRVDTEVYNARILSSGKSIKVSTSGKIVGRGHRHTSLQIADAMETALRLLGSITIKSEFGDIEVRASDNVKARIFTATNTSVLGALAKQLKKLKPTLFFLDEESPVIAQDEWAGKVAGQILHAMGANGHMFSTRKPRGVVFSTGDTSNHSHNMLTLNPEIWQQIMERFNSSDDNGITRNTLEEAVGEDMNLPMISPPRDYNQYGAGGYLTKTMQSRYPMISNNKNEELLGHRRFNPSEEAIASLNYLQKTEWRADRRVMDVALEVLRNVVKETIVDQFEVLSDENEEGKQTYVFGLKMQPRITQNQVAAWKRTGDFVHDHTTEAGDAMSFYHPWVFEWRGRMMTCTTLLSPQNDDLSRGVLRFANSTPLSEDGWIWLQRHTAALMRGQEIFHESGAIFEGLECLVVTKTTKQVKDEWGNIQALMKDKKWQSYDLAVREPLFKSVVEAIAANPLGTFEAWGRGDVFTAKCEGFQRLSACIVLSQAYVEGGIGAEVSLPISHDASSSIYQHASALVRDKKMAKSVNVLPNDSGMPADVYLEIVNHTKKRWHEKGNPLYLKGLMSKEDSKDLANTLLTRKFAKKPVMTIGYGATTYGITSSFLTHNGKAKGILGAYVFVNKETNEQVDVPESEEECNANKKNQWWRVTAHPASLLGDVLKDVDPALHNPIAQTIVDELEKSTYQVLPGIKLVQEFLARQSEEAVSKIVQWDLVDGCTVRNIKLESEGSQKVEAWMSNLSSSKERQASVDKINKLLKVRGTDLKMPIAATKRSTLIEHIVGEAKDSVKRPLRGRISSLLKPIDVELSEAFKEYEALTRRSTFSRRIIADERDSGGEARGLSPNFIHSHDACHMRLVLNDMDGEGIRDAWSVHDAFGAHPNHMHFVRSSAITSFVRTHTNQNGKGILFEMAPSLFADIVKPTMSIKEVEAVGSNEQLLSEYLIS